MSVPIITPLPPERCHPVPDAGLGALETSRGNLPLESVDIAARLAGLLAGVEMTQGFRNPFDVTLEATYVFPLPPRAAVTAFRMTADDRVIDGVLKERGQARADYDRALAEGRRAAIAEEDRPDVFTIRVGNILAGERVRIHLTLSQPLPFEDGAAEFRFPLVVAPRYIPGTPLDGGQVGDGTAPDTDAVPDASRITPPVLLPGFPNPVRLSLVTTIDPAGLGLKEIRSSLHEIIQEGDTVRLTPGERLDRDFILRLGFAPSTSLALVPDPPASSPGARTPAEAGSRGSGPVGEPGGTGDAGPGQGSAMSHQGRATSEGTPPSAEGTFTLTVVPPAEKPGEAVPRDVVLLLDRSGSMAGWKMVAARRAAARIVDTLTSRDRFAVLAFDTVIERAFPDGLTPATDRNRYHAIEHLSRLEARGGTEILAPMEEALRLLAPSTPPPSAELPPPPHPLSGDQASGRSPDRFPGQGPARPVPSEPESSSPLGSTPATGPDRVLVLVTDGQVGNEDQILERTGARLSGVRVHAVGIDRAVNVGFLGRLAVLGSGRCELVESEDRLDEAMEHIHRRIGSPLVTGISLRTDGFDIVPGTVTHAGSLYPGVPLTVSGRYRVGTATDDPARLSPSDMGRVTEPDTSPDTVGTGDERALTVHGLTSDGRPWDTRVPAVIVSGDAAGGAARAVWARAHVRDLEDRYAIGDRSLEHEIVATSLRFGVLCRFTAFVAVDTHVAADGRPEHHVIQPVELPSGWEPPQPVMAAAMTTMAFSAKSAPAPGRPADTPITWMDAGVGPPAAPGSAASRPPRLGSGFTGGQGWSPGGGTAPTTSLDGIRPHLAEELRRLRAVESSPEPVRRRYLADLASRLRVFDHLVGGHAELSALGEALDQAERADVDLADLWRRAVEVLSQLSTGSPEETSAAPSLPPEQSSTAADAGEARAAAEPPTEEPPRSERRPFWKRQ
ncbi:VIT domain-containing protein [Microtetraspora malaysiensis]|uniref:VIT domain-containing protein n=1 Tax=Microtetraspora malaysiensis TaxID=161358 RepID=UPI000A039531|nr:VIT domain-containing protein [Microtetraspora malaysiensis]